MIDISTVGASIKFTGNLDCTISEFSDEGTPFDAPDVDVSTNAKNLNGQMISSRTPSVYPLSVTVIPGSNADKELSKFLARSALRAGSIASILDLTIDSCIITIPNQNESSSSIGSGRVYTYSSGRMKSGPTGPSSSADGRQSARTFTFEFEQFKVD